MSKAPPWLGKLLALATTADLVCTAAEPREDLFQIRDGAVELPAVVSTQAFEEDAEMASYHLLAWKDGPTAPHALLRTPVSELQFLEALTSLGAEAGDALEPATWEQRNDPSSPAPDQVIEGPRVEIELRVPGREQPLSLPDILVDSGARGFDMRFGGHRENIDPYRSGCLVCLYSCPASKVGNAAYTVRDFVKAAARFHARSEVLPPDGTQVTVVFRLAGTRRAP